MYQRIFMAAALMAAGLGVATAADVGAHTSIDGQVFADLSDIDQQQNGTDVAPSGVGFDIKRAYLIVDHSFDDTWSANLTTEAQYIGSSSGTGYSSSTTSNSGGVTEVFIKLLYLQARLNDAFVVHAGSYNSPWYGYAVNLYGYRYIERLMTERLGFANSADWGANASGVAGGNGVFNYSLSVVDGGGYKNPTRTKDVDVEAAILVKPLAWLNFGAGAYSGHLGQVTQTTADEASHTATRWDLIAAVLTRTLRVGVEYLDARDFKTANPSTGVLSGPGGVVVATNATAKDPTGTVVSDQAEGYSSWASYVFLPRWSVFTRYDDVRPSLDYDPNLSDHYLNFGVSYEPIPNIDLALVYKHEKVTDGSLSVSSGDGNSTYIIGGTAAAGTGIHTSGQFNEVGVYTQYTF
ncbi:MAG TPA: hypothetical protein VMD56_08535 [Steroidobacteraceae bacterium]|nr:hypothetical protein [Steroidobacteraceae bacterium]